jgi:hypothetical protein
MYLLIPVKVKLTLHNQQALNKQMQNLKELFGTFFNVSGVLIMTIIQWLQETIQS